MKIKKNNYRPKCSKSGSEKSLIGAQKNMTIKTQRFEKTSFAEIEMAIVEFIKTNPKIKVICSTTSSETIQSTITSTRGIIGTFRGQTITKHYAFIIYEEGE